MKKAFTLLELLVVVAIMGLLGTISVGGYRQMQRGMEERGALETASRFIRMAYQRAQIDRKPTAVYFWNETMREKDADGYENEVVVGKAVAVRQHGRISAVSGANMLLDEFGDLNHTYPTNASSSASGTAGDTFRLYNLDKPSDGISYSIVNATVKSEDIDENFAFHNPTGGDGKGSGNGSAAGRMKVWGFYKAGGGNANWQNGSAYGFEFGSITLPKGYIFTRNYSTDVSSPVEDLKSSTMVFLPTTVGSTGEGGSDTIDIYALRPSDGGGLEPKKVDSTESPGKKMN